MTLRITTKITHIATKVIQITGLLIIGSSAAMAAIVYQYTGNNYEPGFILDPGNPYTASMQITGSFTVDAPLVNFSGDLIPISKNWTFSDGFHTFTDTDNVLWRADMTTDSSGNPVSWDIGMLDHDTIPVLDEYLQSLRTRSNSSLEYDTARINIYVDCIGFNCWQLVAYAESSIPGTWQVVPIPPALYLFGSGLIGLVGVARKRAA